jgi:hypothetical protein
METQAKFADTIYSRDAHGLFVNLFIPSVVNWGDAGMTIRQSTSFPNEPRTRITVTSGQATMTIRVRIPSWVAGRAQAWLNGTRLDDPGTPGSWLAVERNWQPGDGLEVSLPMRLSLNPTPDDPAVQAVTYGPVVLSGAYGADAATAMPRLDTGSVTATSQQPLTFEATAGGKPVTLIPIAQMQHQHYNAYWLT